MKELQKFGAVKSKIECKPFHKFGEEWAHVKSWTRTVHMTFEKNQQLPDTLIISDEDERFSLTTQVGHRKCFKCKSFHPVGKDCSLTFAVVVVQHESQVGNLSTEVPAGYVLKPLPTSPRLNSIGETSEDSNNSSADSGT
ncbi:unnamed protein product [Allacma fusca]|uniref:Uncharacterized protein n=1 Tax=Allacma fusca TaxID=39272 RepID=A0A8J2PED7_9HEXA|nr:unnamed protein product [Allacma fusca]